MKKFLKGKGDQSNTNYKEFILIWNVWWCPLDIVQCRILHLNSVWIRIKVVIFVSAPFCEIQSEEETYLGLGKLHNFICSLQSVENKIKLKQFFFNIIEEVLTRTWSSSPCWLVQTFVHSHSSPSPLMEVVTFESITLEKYKGLSRNPVLVILCKLVPLFLP